jgi:hypothetical protein
MLTCARASAQPSITVASSVLKRMTRAHDFDCQCPFRSAGVYAGLDRVVPNLRRWAAASGIIRARLAHRPCDPAARGVHRSREGAQRRQVRAALPRCLASQLRACDGSAVGSTGASGQMRAARRAEAIPAARTMRTRTAPERPRSCRRLHRCPNRPARSALDSP